MKFSRKSLWIGTLGIAALGTAAGLGWIRSQSSFEPLEAGLQEYSSSHWDAAADLAKRRLVAVKDDPFATRLLARASIRLGKDSTAVPLYDRLSPGLLTGEDLFLMGTAMARSGNQKGSIDLWERALSADPDYPDTLFALGQHYFVKNWYNSAALLARRLAHHHGWQVQAEELIGQIQFAQNDAEGASWSWHRALEGLGALPAGEQMVVLRIELARALLCIRKPVEARAQLQLILERGPHPEATWLLSRAYLQEGALSQAGIALEQCGAFASESPTRFEPAPFVGSARCAQCHFEKYQRQRISRHARTFHRTAELTGLSIITPSVSDPMVPGVVHSLKTDRGELVQETQVEDRVFRAVVNYAFGSGDVGRSLIGRDPSGHIKELRLSIYQEGSRLLWDLTPGQPQRHLNPENYLGVPLAPDDLYSCFRCHVTNPRAVILGSGPEAADSAIGCEKCHGPGGNHLLAVASNFLDPAIGRPALVSGLPVVQICAQCHNGRSGQQVRPDEPDSVHFQSATLTWSRCFTESNHNLDCVTCHDPHENATRDAEFYESRCLSCHGRGESSVPAKDRRSRLRLALTPERTTCPVNPQAGCITCHMPAVKGVIPHMTPTDHFIRVHEGTIVRGE
jgi:tetratricopeptide (TPR) repeat protein